MSFDGGEDQTLNSPVAVATSSEGHIHVCDRGNKKVKVFDECGAFLHLIELPEDKGEILLVVNNSFHI